MYLANNNPLNLQNYVTEKIEKKENKKANYLSTNNSYHNSCYKKLFICRFMENYKHK